MVFLLAPASASAATGVGVGTGKIVLNEALKPGVIYSLPSMVVFNTGDYITDYEMEVTFNERQPELKPAADWVDFSPKRFSLAPGQSKQVSMTIKLPADVRSGKYYAYLEAHSIRSAGSTGGASISAAAAAKFYFDASGRNETPKTVSSDSPTTKTLPSDDSVKNGSFWRPLSFVSSYALNVKKELVGFYAPNI